jgi:hypothetical protein
MKNDHVGSGSANNWPPGSGSDSQDYSFEDPDPKEAFTDPQPCMQKKINIFLSKIRIPDSGEPFLLHFKKDDILYVDNTMYNGVPGRRKQYETCHR